MTDHGGIRIPTRREVLEEMRGQGWRIAAVLPYHYPRALLRALEIHPIEVWGPPGIDPAQGNRHFQPYTCAIVRNATSLLLGDVGKLTDLALVPHNCDALQGMGSVLQDFVDIPTPVLTFYPPRSRSAADLPYLVEELKVLGRRLEEISGRTLSEERLRKAVELEAEADEAFAELATARQKYRETDKHFYEVLRSREYLPLEQFLKIVASLPQGRQEDDGLPLVLSGIVPEPMSLFDHLNDMGARIAGDDLACGSRRIYPWDLDEGDPWVVLARSLMSLPPDPLTGAPIRDRIAHLESILKASSARGVLVYDVKFCEPELFDLPIVRESLVERGYPVLHVEHEMGREIPGQVLTRIEAFVEMLR